MINFLPKFRKNTAIFIFFILPFVKVGLAQDVIFSQFYKNPLYMNPALTALETCGRTYLNYRNASTGPFEQNVYSLGFDVPFKSTNLGLGGLFQWQEEGLKRTGIFGFQFSRKVPITPDVFVSMGMEGGGIYTTWNTADMKLPSDIAQTNTNAGQPEIPSSFTYNLAAGAGLSYKTHYAGFAVRHLTAPYIKTVNLNVQIHRKYTGHYGARIPYKMQGSKNGYLAPQVIFISQNGNNSLTTGVYGIYNKIGAGVYMRAHFPFQTSFLIIMTTIKSKNYEFSYSYDFPVNGTGLISGVHEVAVLYYLRSFKKRYNRLNQKNCLSF